jgi:hypothetical protein
VLNGVWKLRIGISVECEGPVCTAGATVENPVTFALLGSVGNTGILLANPNASRRPWYSVTHFVAEPYNSSATFWGRSESYNSSAN